MNEWKKNENGVSGRGELPTKWPKQVKENQTNWGNSFSQFFSYPLSLLNKTHILKLGQLCGSHMNFFHLDIHRFIPLYLFPKHHNWGSFWVFCVFLHWISQITYPFRSVWGMTCPHGYPNLLQTLSKNFRPFTHL